MSGRQAGPSQATFKSRKPPARSCDGCRQRKIRCDGFTNPSNQCTHCLEYGELCTYAQPHEKRGPKNKVVEELKQKVASLEVKLRMLSVCSLCSRPLQSSTFETSSPRSSGNTSLKAEPQTLLEADVSQEQEPEEDFSAELTERLRGWKISNGFFKFQHRLFGSTSNANLLQNALAVKEKYLGRPSTEPHFRRSIYWSQFPWEKEFCSRQRPHYIFPPSDLLNQLLELYFARVHPTFPILHRDSFQRHMVEGLHLRDTSFGAVVLAVLALASRYSDDPRVMIDGHSLSSGWTFAAQVRPVPNLFEPTVYDAQFYSLMVLFSLGGSTPHIVWVYLGLAVRVIQYHGQFVRAPGDTKFEEELWNRAFWSVFILDGLVSSLPGRPPAIHPEEFDVDPPLEVDDEYWGKGFVQPLGKPSMLSFFVYFVRLFEILSKVVRRLYASKRSQTWTTEQEKETIAELDSLMNDFTDTLPPHLRWDPDNEPGAFFDQATVIHITYYWLQITIHRTSIQRKTVLAEPSRFICITAARSSLSIADIWITKSQCLPSIFLQNSTFISAVILLLNIFASKRAGLTIHWEKDVAQVRAAMALLESCETRWQSGGRLWELLAELQSLDGHLSVRGPLRNEAPSNTDAVSPIELDSQFNREDLPLAGPQSEPSWAPLTGEQPAFQPGTSIEQLLSATEATSGDVPGWSQPTGLFDNELMSLWFASPADLMNIDQWDAYIGNRAVSDSSRFNKM